MLLNAGGRMDGEIKAATERWRIRIESVVFTFYSNGTLFVTAPSSRRAADLVKEVCKIVGPLPQDRVDRDRLIGLDETGKGEILGHMVLAGAMIPKTLVEDIRTQIGPADTKKRRTTRYWRSLLIRLDHLRSKGLEFLTESIPPWHVDRYNINKIMDLKYKRILDHFIHGPGNRTEKLRIVVDDYGVGRILGEYLGLLEKRGAEVRVEFRADERYAEVALASVVAKSRREDMMAAISRSYSLPNTPVGSGNAGDVKTVQWLRRWKESGKEWAWFVRRSFRTVAELDGRPVPKKEEPPIREELLSHESREVLRTGTLSVKSLTILCPKCGSCLRSCRIVPFETKLVARCLNCNEEIRDLATTLLYYNGCVIPDSSAIITGMISKDLESGRFFEGFTFVIPPQVRRECDTVGGRKELGRIAEFASMGRIRLEQPKEMSIEDRTGDELVVDCAEAYDGMILTKDGGMYLLAGSRGIFCLQRV